MNTMGARRFVSRAGVVCFCLLSAACASGGSAAGGASRSSRSPITHDEIGSDRATLDLYTVVQQLRPNWLQVGKLVLVAIDGRLQPSVNADPLRLLRGAEVKEIRFMRGQDAVMRFGIDSGDGVIVVTTDSGKG